METEITMQLMSTPVRFTQDGKVAVVDAIKALSACTEARQIWQRLKQSQPELPGLCQRYDFQENRSVAVVDSDGWEQIEEALLDYLVEEDPYG